MGRAITPPSRIILLGRHPGRIALAKAFDRPGGGACARLTDGYGVHSCSSPFALRRRCRRRSRSLARAVQSAAPEILRRKRCARRGRHSTITYRSAAAAGVDGTAGVCVAWVLNALEIHGFPVLGWRMVREQRPKANQKYLKFQCLGSCADHGVSHGLEIVVVWSVTPGHACRPASKCVPPAPTAVKSEACGSRRGSSML